MSNQNQRFNFKTAKIISIAIAGIALMLLGRFIVQSLASTLWLNNAINGDVFVAVLNSELVLSLVLRGVGVGLFLFSMYRAYVNRSAFTFRAFKKTLVLSCLLCLVFIMSSTVVEAPLAAADKMNTIAQGYKICISDGYYDYWIGQLSNNQYFAVRGSDGNAMTFVEPWQLSPPWAAYAANYTALEQQVFAAMTSGTVYSKEVPFDYNLTIPSNVRFIENVNGLERNFVSSANSQGSPYTISQDTVNSGYYLAQDSAGRYLDQWSSSDYATVFNNTNNAINATGGKINTAPGIGEITINSGLKVGPTARTYLEYAYDFGGNTLYASNTLNADVISSYGGGSFIPYYISIDHCNINGNNLYTTAGNGMNLTVYRSLIQNCIIQNCSETGLALRGISNGGGGTSVYHVVSKYNDGNGVSMSDDSFDDYWMDVKVFANGLSGVYQDNGNLNFVMGASYQNGRFSFECVSATWTEITTNWIGQSSLGEFCFNGTSGYWGSFGASVTGNTISIDYRNTTGIRDIFTIDGATAAWPYRNVAITGNNINDAGDYQLNSSYSRSLLNCINYVHDVNFKGNSISGNFSFAAPYVFGDDCVNVDVDGNTIWEPNGTYSVGVIGYPVATNNNILYSVGGTRQIMNNTVYANNDFTKNLYFEYGNITQIQINNQTVYTHSNVSVTVKPNQQFSYIYYNTYDQTNTDGESSSTSDIYGNTWDAQNFTAGASDWITNTVALKIRGVGYSASTFVQVGLWTVNSTGFPAPGATSLANVTVNVAALPHTSDWYNFKFASPITLTANTAYAITVNVIGGDASNYVTLRKAGTGTYAGGMLLTSANNGASWSSVSAQDLMFTVYGMAPIIKCVA